MTRHFQNSFIPIYLKEILIMKTTISAIVLGVSLIASTSIFAEGTRIDNSTIDVASKNMGSVNYSLDSTSSLVSTGAINLQDSIIIDSNLMNSSMNDGSVNMIENGSYSTVVTGSLTAH
jgi:hypothetical protein